MRCWLWYWCTLAVVKDMTLLRNKIYEQLIMFTQSNPDKAQQLINARGIYRGLKKARTFTNNNKT
jgi:hypothetical protein